VIPFYWGYRASTGQNRRRNGQWLDEAGNRLDKDLSKGGGPFANATTNLADMWKSGAPAFGGFIDWLSGDPLRPVLEGPGRMYFVLAAQRLAALVRMIRKYDPNDTVNIVAHSQGCLIALLAQAFLMEDGHRTADTLVLTHPPYGLEPTFLGTFSSGGGKDPAMEQFYASLRGLQTVRARLDTLINIVRGVAAQRRDGWSADELAHMRRGGLHSLAWEDRDNRGKVYLYFCPEDMTVALRNVQGIGWQGVPDQLDGRHPAYAGPGAPQPASRPPGQAQAAAGTRAPLPAAGVHQKPRDVGGQTAAFPVGLDPCHFTLRLEGEPDQDHVAPNHHPAHPPPRGRPQPPHRPGGPALHQRRAPAQALPRRPLRRRPVVDPEAPGSQLESVDPIDAAVAVSRDQGLGTREQRIPDPRPAKPPQPFYPDDRQPLGALERAEVQALLNAGKAEGDQIKLESATRGPTGSSTSNAGRAPTKPACATRTTPAPAPSTAPSGPARPTTPTSPPTTSPSAAARRLGQGVLRLPVRGGGLAVEGAQPGEKIRPGILTWSDFLKKHKQYFECEPPEIRDHRRQLRLLFQRRAPRMRADPRRTPRAVISETDDPGIPSFGKGTA
jgi:hypothetical protein